MCQKQNQESTPTYRHNLTAQLLLGILLSWEFFYWFFLGGFVWCDLIFLASLHSECNEAQLFTEINGYHRDEDSAIYTKEHISDQDLWVYHKQVGSWINVLLTLGDSSVLWGKKPAYVRLNSAADNTIQLDDNTRILI